MRQALAAAFLALACAACGAGAVAPAPPPAVPKRVASLDPCADQIVLRFVPRAHIVALSPEAEKSFSYLRAEAAGLPTVRATVEDVLALQPDLVVRAYGGGAGAAQAFQRAQIPVLELGFAASLAEIRSETLRLSSALGAAEEGLRLVADLDARLQAIPRAAGVEALYVSQGGVTTGPGSLVHSLIEAAGLNNAEPLPGWRPLPLEQLARDRPDLIATAFFGGDSNGRDAWSLARHPIVARSIASGAAAPLDEAWTACPGWFAIEAVEALAAAAPKSPNASELNAPKSNAPKSNAPKSNGPKSDASESPAL